MSSFYVGMLSWFEVHFIAQMMRKIFKPPRQVETLDEKASLNIFMKEIMLRVIKGLKMKVDNITTFYKIWDDKRVVLKMTQGYKLAGVTE